MPYRYEYGVEDEYSGSSYRASQAGDEEGAVEGEYTVLLPDGRTQHVRYGGQTFVALPIFPFIRKFLVVLPIRMMSQVPR